MGQKVNPIGLRLGINRTWDSRWYADNDYTKLLFEDFKLRDHLRKKLAGAGVSRVVIERPAKKPRVTIYAARPGNVNQKLMRHLLLKILPSSWKDVWRFVVL